MQTMTKTVAAAGAGVAAFALAAVIGWSAMTADGMPAGVLAAGKALYAQHCAGCHGADLEGQPDWQTPRASGRLPAPPHDASGHTWHHPDAVLFEITKHGPAAVVGGGYESDMPGFAGTLSDDEIRAVLAFIKSTWPQRERSYQQQRTRQWQAQAETQE